MYFLAQWDVDPPMTRFCMGWNSPKVPQHGVSSGPIVLSGGWISRVKNPMKWQMPGICVIGAVNIGPKILRRYSEMARQSRSIVGYHPTGPRAPGTSVAQPRDTTYRIARCYEFTIVKLSHPQNKLREPFPFFDSSASSCSTKSSTCSQADCWISTMEPWQFPSWIPLNWRFHIYSTPRKNWFKKQIDKVKWLHSWIVHLSVSFWSAKSTSSTWACQPSLQVQPSGVSQ